jgi:anaerobic selenocysteine-containing dehydrogenase
VLTTSDFYSFNHAGLERPDLLGARRPRVINHSALGDALTAAQPRVRAVLVYNNNPVAVCPDSAKVVAGFEREDLFCVVMDSFLTDTADYADIVLPATTQLEHYDIHKSYGHLYVLANNPAIAPVGESLPNSEVFRRLAARMGFDEPCFKDSDEDICRTALESQEPRMRGVAWKDVKESGWQRLAVAERFAPFAEGGFPTPSGKCEFKSSLLADQGMDPLPFFNPPAESVVSNPELAKRFPLAFLSPPARNFLNSSFANMKRFRDIEGEPRLEMHAADAAARGIRMKTWCACTTTAAAISCAPASTTSRAAAWSSRRRLVAQARARRAQRQQRYVAAHCGSRRRRDVLRLPRGGREGLSLPARVFG